MFKLAEQSSKQQLFTVCAQNMHLSFMHAVSQQWHCLITESMTD